MEFAYKTLTGVLLFGLLASCGNRDSRYDTLADARPYLSTSQYSAQLKACAQAETPFGSCSLNKLPTVGMEFSEQSVEDVMSRVLVSHDWMGERFEQLLQTLPPDILQLLGAVTAIVIDADIRPSYYQSLTGAIYLDPASLWTTLEEKNVISRSADYREAYADPMSFRSYWRLVKDNADAYNWYGLNSTVERPFKDVVLPMAALLYHELAHANDLLPTSAYDEIDRSKSIYSVTEKLYEKQPSTLLKAQYPLGSEDMYHMANILFSGATPSESDTQITASEIGAFFSSDPANDDYSYTSQYEDLAMLVEEAMLKFHFDVDRDMAFIDYVADAAHCDDQKIGWGVRNRIADPEVMERAKFVLGKLLPDTDYTEFFDALNAPIELPAGMGWCESKSVGATPANNKLQIQSRKQQQWQPESMRRPYKTHY